MKLAKHHNLWLALCVLVLAVMCYMSISAPIKFKKEQQFREQAVPLAECGTTYDTYLNGLDENSIANLIEKANERGRYAGIRMGDIAAGDTQLSINK